MAEDPVVGVRQAVRDVAVGQVRHLEGQLAKLIVEGLELCVELGRRGCVLEASLWIAAGEFSSSGAAVRRPTAGVPPTTAAARVAFFEARFAWPEVARRPPDFGTRRWVRIATKYRFVAARVLQRMYMYKQAVGFRFIIYIAFNKKRSFREFRSKAFESIR